MDSQTQAPKHNPELASSSAIPLGYKFTLNDDEVLYYLNGFLQGNKDIFHNVPIHRANIYESTPQQLSKEYKKGNEKEWFFITERTKKSEGGTRYIRSDKGGGSWRTTQEGKKIEAEGGVVGYKTALEYCIGSVKGDWLMQEYWLDSEGHNKVDHALCKIYLTRKAADRKAEEAENEKKKKIKIEEEAFREITDLLFAPEAQQQTGHQVPLDELHKKMNEFHELINGPPPEQVIPENDVANPNYMGDLYPQQLVKEDHEYVHLTPKGAKRRAEETENEKKKKKKRKMTIEEALEEEDKLSTVPFELSEFDDMFGDLSNFMDESDDEFRDRTFLEEFFREDDTD